MDDIRDHACQNDGQYGVKLKVKEAIIVEGKYDQIKLSNFIEGVILPTGGFGIFKDKQKAALIRRYASTCGVIILTDSDRAGFIIRNYVTNICQGGKVSHAYIPDIIGKEKRKEKPSKAGTLGVEGMEREILEKALKSCATAAPERQGRRIEKCDLYELGLAGKEDSKIQREKVLKELDLPKNLSANGLLDVLNATATWEELKEICKKISEK